MNGHERPAVAVLPARRGAVVVRPAKRSDVAAITDVYHQAVVDTTASYDLAPVTLESRLAWFDQRVGDGWPVLVATDPLAEVRDSVLGWSTYGTFRAKAGYDLTVEHSPWPTSAGSGASSTGDSTWSSCSGS